MSRQAHALDVLLAEVDTAAPHRSVASDGGLGDPAHAARASDHNPNAAGVWRARDFTHDPAGGLDCNELAIDLVSMYLEPDVHPAMRSGAYTIWNGRIFSYDRRTEGWRPYTGANPHNHHLHQSVATAAAGYDSNTPWGVMKEHDDMTPDQDARLKRVEGALKALVGADLDGDIEKLANSVLAGRRAANARADLERARDLRTFRELAEQGKTDDEILAAVRAADAKVDA